MPFEISLAQWSLHRMIFADQLHPLDFPRYAVETFGIRAVEYVNRAYKEHYADDDTRWVNEVRKRCDDLGVTSLLIMIDRQGDLGDPEDAKRQAAVENHYKWVEAAKELGCHSIRVNARTHPQLPQDEQHRHAVSGLARLTAFAKRYGINIVVENHGGLSSNGAWLAGVIREVNERVSGGCGTLPDFGNFCMDWERKEDSAAWYDRYQGVAELMPFAKAVSAKSNDFDEEGNEIHTDFRRMMKIVLEAGYRGYVGIEYEGQQFDEPIGVRKTQELLKRLRAEFVAGAAVQ